MLWPIKRSRKSRKKSDALRKKSARHLAVEYLEPRHLLTGVVHICTDGPFGPPAPAFVPACPAGGVPAGELVLVGDASNNSVEIRQGAFVGEFEISDGNRTLLYHNNALVTSPHTVFSVLGEINVQLDAGNDNFSLLGSTTGGESTLAALNIDNGGGDDTNLIEDAMVMNPGGLGSPLSVESLALGTSTLTVRDATIIGDLFVDNDGAGAFPGDSSTTIENTRIEGRLSIENAFGDDIIQIDNVQVGTVPPPVPVAPPVVDIDNGDGGSVTTFLGGTTVFGAVDILNGGNVLGTLQSIDLVNFDDTEVLGAVVVDNGMGNSRVLVANSSTLGSDPLAGGIVDIDSGDGFDDFQFDNSSAPYGVDIDNTGPADGGTQFWGSQTVITDSSVGTHPLAPGDLVFRGDAGIDTINVTNTVVGRNAIFHLFAGNDILNILTDAGGARTTIGALEVLSDHPTGPAGDDKVIVRDATIQIGFHVELYGGDDRLELRGDTTLLGPVAAILVDGGAGPLDVFIRDITVIAPGLLPPGFEL